MIIENNQQTKEVEEVVKEGLLCPQCLLYDSCQEIEREWRGRKSVTRVCNDMLIRLSK